MANLRRGASLVLAAIALMGLNACDDDPTGAASDDEWAILSVSPAGGAANVDPNSPVTIEFGKSTRVPESLPRWQESAGPVMQVPEIWRYKRCCTSPVESRSVSKETFTSQTC